MSVESWLSQLGRELRRQGVAAGQIESVLADVRTHLRDSAEDPYRAFGSPERYAVVVAESLGTPPSPGRTGGPVRLEARGIRKSYGRRRVLTDVDLTVRSGQIAAVIGANGCGKSTLLRICAGLATPDAGTVTVHGELSYSPQEGGTSPYLLADEHFVLVGAGQGLSRDHARAVGRRRAEELGWRDVATTQARHLSGGTRQKLNLVMSTLTEPDLLLLDEPYQGFDRGTYVNLWEQLWRLRDKGAAIVVVTHLLHQLDQVDLVLDLTKEEGA
jgi:ABC-type multidrug transport system ATPase subunit